MSNEFLAIKGWKCAKNQSQTSPAIGLRHCKVFLRPSMQRWPARDSVKTSFSDHKDSIFLMAAIRDSFSNDNFGIKQSQTSPDIDLRHGKIFLRPDMQRWPTKVLAKISFSAYSNPIFLMAAIRDPFLMTILGWKKVESSSGYWPSPVSDFLTPRYAAMTFERFGKNFIFNL